MKGIIGDDIRAALVICSECRGSREDSCDLCRFRIHGDRADNIQMCDRGHEFIPQTVVIFNNYESITLGARHAR